MKRDVYSVALAGAVAGLSWWFSSGVLAVERAGSGPVRIGLLPGPALLPALVALGAVAAVAAHRYTRLGHVEGWHYPLFCSAVTLLPWLPFDLPAAVLVWAGPSAWFVWGGVALAVGAAVVRSGACPIAAASARLFRPGVAPWTAGVLAAAVYGAAAVYLAPVFPGGDEPHYLVIAQSILEDGDLRIENNHERRDYYDYFKGDLAPHYLRRGTDGEIYSVHAPGLPALLVAPYAVGGYPAAAGFLVVVAATLSGLLWRASFLVTGTAPAAWFGWAAVAPSSPVLLHSFAVYPETTGALLVMMAVVRLAALDEACAKPPAGGRDGGSAGSIVRSRWVWLLAGASLALLPWLHTRYAVLALALGLVLAARLAGRKRTISRTGLLAAIPVASAALWFFFFRTIYGTFSPAAPYGHYTQTRLDYVPAGLSGLLFDQQFGLLPNAPAFALAFAGFVPLFRSRPRLALELLAVVVSYAAVVATYAMWWGGWSAPARFLVPVLPVLAIPAAAWWNRRSPAGRLAGEAVVATGLLVSLAVTIAGRGALIFNSRDGVSRLFEHLVPLADLNRALPSSFQGVPGDLALKSFAWLSITVVASLVSLGMIRRLRVASVGGRAAVLLAGAALGVTAATEAGWRTAGAPKVAGSEAQLAMVGSVDRYGNGIGVRYRPFSLERPEEAVKGLRLTMPGRRPRRQDDTAWSLSAVPAGVYRLDPSCLAARTGALSARIGRGDSPVAVWEVSPRTRAAEHVLRLPCAVNALVFDVGDGQAGIDPSSLALQPLEAWPGRGCPVERARRARRYGGATVFFFDDHAYDEEPGFWVRGGAEAIVAVDDENARSVSRLRIRAGGAPVEVRLASGGWRLDLSLAEWEARDVAVPVDRATGAAILHIAPDTGFVPSEVDPSSRDRRFLGCWVEVPE